MHGFTRLLAREAADDVRREFPGIKVSRAGVCGPSGSRVRKQYFFEFEQPGFPSLSEWITAEDAYDARAKAWRRYMEKFFEQSEAGRLTRLAKTV
jgi:hypothetical protein